MKNMKRYIDAYKIPYHDLSDGRGKCEVAFLEDIIKVPTANVRENIKGKWIKHNLKNQNVPWGYDCSVCGEWFVIDRNILNKYKFCPNCGADMKGDNNV